MRKEALQERLAKVDDSINQMNQQIQQYVSNLNILIGSKNELLHWIAECDKPQEEKVESLKEEVEVECASSVEEDAA